MKNITITVTDDLHRRARMCAIDRDTTVTALLRQLLTDIDTSQWSESYCEILMNETEVEPE
jgi:hypothetical protein